MSEKLFPLNKLWFKFIRGSNLENKFTVDSLAETLEALGFIVVNDDRTKYNETEKFKPYRTRFKFLRFVQDKLLIFIFIFLISCRGGTSEPVAVLPNEPMQPPVELVPPEQADDQPPAPEPPVVVEPPPETPPVEPQPPVPACFGHPMIGTWLNDADSADSVTFNDDCSGFSTKCSYTFDSWYQSNQSVDGSSIMISVPSSHFHVGTNFYPCIPFNGIVKQYKNFGILFMNPNSVQMNLDYGGVQTFTRAF